MRGSRLCAFLGMFALIAVSLSLLAQKPEPPMRGIHWARGHQPPAAQANPDMTWFMWTSLAAMQIIVPGTAPDHAAALRCSLRSSSIWMAIRAAIRSLRFRQNPRD